MDLTREIKLKKKEKEKVWEVEQKKIRGQNQNIGCLIYHFNDIVNCVWTVYICGGILKTGLSETVISRLYSFFYLFHWL